MTMKFDTYAKGYANLWRQAELSPATKSATLTTAREIVSPTALEHYVTAAAASNVPAGLIAALNYRESGGRLDRYLGNGDPLNKPSVHEPAGRGPFTSWELGAADALAKTERPANGIWSIEFALYFAENFNGRGYQKHNENSPYVWSQTNFEQTGMFTSDHGYDPSVRDARPGVAALFLAFQTVKPSLCLPSLTQAPEKPMSTSPTPVAKDPLLPIINILSEVQSALPIFGGFLPPPFGAILSIGVPALEDTLKFLDIVRVQGVSEPTLATFLEQIKTHIEAMTTQLRKP